jgi:hypothetical protein
VTHLTTTILHKEIVQLCGVTYPLEWYSYASQRIGAGSLMYLEKSGTSLTYEGVSVDFNDIWRENRHKLLWYFVMAVCWMWIAAWIGVLVYIGMLA